jgi:inosose dehydratase
MVLEISESALSAAANTGSAIFAIDSRLKDSAWMQHNMKLAGLALVCAWDGETEAPNEKAKRQTSPSTCFRSTSPAPCSAP